MKTLEKLEQEIVALLRSADSNKWDGTYQHRNPGSDGYNSGKMAAYEEVLYLIREMKKAMPE